MTGRKTHDGETTPLKADDGSPAVGASDETQARTVRVDKSYVPRSYAEAMTKEQRETLKEEGLL